MFQIVPYYQADPSSSLGTVYDDSSEAIDAMREFESQTEKFYIYQMHPVWNDQHAQDRFMIGFHVVLLDEDAELFGVLRQTED